jgi:SAP domain-containing new25
MPHRPMLDARLDPSLFREHYWLKSELAAFCRTQGLRTDGPKTALANRIEARLQGAPPTAEPSLRRNSPMPTAFDREMVIGPGWRCSQELRAFFTAELSRPYRFDGAMRDRIRQGAGLTLGQALDEATSKARPVSAPVIAPQFEYNRFMRAYRAARPGVSHAHVVAAWRAYRNTPVSDRPALEAMAQARLG